MTLKLEPRVVGGRDRLAGGTWLAIRERRAAVAMLNRRDDPPPPVGDNPQRRSRGLLTLEVASVIAKTGSDDGGLLARAGLERARQSLSDAPYAPFSLAFLSPDACWVLAHAGNGEPS